MQEKEKKHTEGEREQHEMKGKRQGGGWGSWGMKTQIQNIRNGAPTTTGERERVSFRKVNSPAQKEGGEQRE